MDNYFIVDFMKKHAFFLLGGACLVAVGIIYVLGRNASAEIVRTGELLFDAAEAQEESAPPAENSPDSRPSETPEEPTVIVVHIVGAVNSPGVYELPYGARVNDVLALAGGEKDYADLARVNLAAVAVDAMQIIIPAVGEDIDELLIYPEGSEPTPSAPQTQVGGLVNINTATPQELQTLPGIGPVLSQSIIDFRETHGNFHTVDELQNVSGIGAATMSRLRSLVTV